MWKGTPQQRLVTCHPCVCLPGQQDEELREHDSQRRKSLINTWPLYVPTCSPGSNCCFTPHKEFDSFKKENLLAQGDQPAGPKLLSSVCSRISAPVAWRSIFCGRVALFHGKGQTQSASTMIRSDQLRPLKNHQRPISSPNMLRQEPK